MSEADAGKMIMPSAGVHVTLPDYYSPQHLGMIVPKTKDGRVVFMLPWEDATIAGTTGALHTRLPRTQPLCGYESQPMLCLRGMCILHCVATNQNPVGVHCSKKISRQNTIDSAACNL